MKQNGFTPVVIVILITTLVVGGYLIYKLPRIVTPPQNPQATQSTPTPSSKNESTNSAKTANWKIYTNDKLKYQLKYPSDWWIDNRTTTSDQIELYNFDFDKARQENTDGKNTKIVPDDEVFKIVILIDKSHTNINDALKIIQQVIDPTTGKPYIVIKKEEVHIDSHKGLYYEVKSSRVGSLAGDTVVEIPQGLLYIRFWRSVNFESNKKIYKDILSTFKFSP